MCDFTGSQWRFMRVGVFPELSLLEAWWVSSRVSATESANNG